MSNFKDKMFLIRKNMIIESAYKKGLAKPFDENVYNELERHFASGLPISILIKYLRPHDYGDCYLRSFYLLSAFKGALLVRGHRKDMAIAFGKDADGHGWVEHEGWVYDPTNLCAYKKEVYYKAFGVSDTIYHDEEKYSLSPLYKEMMTTTLDDFKVGGSKRIDLCTLIPLTQKICETNKEFEKELNRYLESIDYDYKEILDELNEAIKNVENKQKARK